MLSDSHVARLGRLILKAPSLLYIPKIIELKGKISLLSLFLDIIHFEFTFLYQVSTLWYMHGSWLLQ